MTFLAHGSGFDDLLIVLVPVVFIVVYRIFRGPAPPETPPETPLEDRPPPPDDQRAPR